MNAQYRLSQLVVIIFAAIALNQLACSNASFESRGGTPNSVEPNNSGLNGGPITQGADRIQINDGDGVITWSGNNIYVVDGEDCVRGILRFAGDTQAAAKIAELFSLIDSSTVGLGSLSSPASDSVYLNIRYSNGQTRTFNLINGSASVNEETLSNGPQIIEFFNEIDVQIRDYGVRNCNNGKK